jgi:outer membrane immunogenic protein
MKKFLLASASFAILASGMTAATAADIARRPMPTKAVPYVAPYYNWTGFYAGINGGGAFGGRTGFGAKADGGLVGGTLGYNWQAGNTVFGLETDLDWTNIRGTGTSAVLPAFAVETKNSYLGTVRGRVGYAWDRTLLYVTGGLAYGDVRNSAAFGSASETKAGYTLGGGLEYAIAGPWTVKAEYLYVDLGNAAPLPVTGESSRFRTNLVRAGLNYRF